jgi:hypothetical protein
VFMRREADTAPMDAFELTRPILSDGRRIAVTPGRAKAAPVGLLASARRYVNQLPLGSWSGPAFDGLRWNPRAAAREVERALFRAAAASGVAVGIDDSPAAIANRLVRCRVIVVPAADGAIALLQLLAQDEGVGDAAKLADRLIGYLDHRAASAARPARRIRSDSLNRAATN